MYTQYTHHNRIVWTRDDLKGTHRQHCLCYACRKFFPGAECNCPIAKTIFAVDVSYNVTTPVYECPEFAEKVDENA